MSRKKKISKEEAKLKKQEYDRKRRERMKADPVTLGILREKERIKYLNKKEKGQVKPISAMSSRERRQKRKNWKKNSQAYRDKIVKVRKNLAKPMQNNDELRNLSVNRRRQQLRRHRGILYAKISRLQKKLKQEIRRKERFRKRCQRQNKNNQTSPEVKVSALLKNVRIPEIVKKKEERKEEEGALVNGMKRGSKYWKWPKIRDKQLYAWHDILRKIEPPKLISKGCYFIKDLN